MPNPKRTHINSILYTYGELRALHYLLKVDKAGIHDAADYCGVTNSTAHTYLCALIRKGLVAWDEKRSNVPSDYWCANKVKARAILKKAPSGIIDYTIEITPIEAKTVKLSSSGHMTRVSGVWFSSHQLTVLDCIFKAAGPIVVTEVHDLTGISIENIRSTLKILSRKELITGEKQGKDEHYHYQYRCSNRRAVEAIFRKIAQSQLEDAT